MFFQTLQHNGSQQLDKNHSNDISQKILSCAKEAILARLWPKNMQAYYSSDVL